jgi:hypothetical protein
VPNRGIRIGKQRFQQQTPIRGLESSDELRGGAAKVGEAMRGKFLDGIEVALAIQKVKAIHGGSRHGRAGILHGREQRLFKFWIGLPPESFHCRGANVFIRVQSKFLKPSLSLRLPAQERYSGGADAGDLVHQSRAYEPKVLRRVSRGFNQNEASLHHSPRNMRGIQIFTGIPGQIEAKCITLRSALPGDFQRLLVGNEARIEQFPERYYHVPHIGVPSESFS